MLSCTILNKGHAYNYSLNNDVLSTSTDSKYKYLGIIISSDLKWNTHIDNILNKANQILGFIKRHLSKCDKTMKLLAYKTLVRPILEYSSSVWDPEYVYQIDKLERIQRRAARFILTRYD